MTLANLTFIENAFEANISPSAYPKLRIRPYAPGVQPIYRLKTEVKEGTLENPTREHTAPTPIPEASSSLAKAIRRSVRYRCGVNP
jgi:hypothetical protein